MDTLFVGDEAVFTQLLDGTELGALWSGEEANNAGYNSAYDTDNVSCCSHPSATTVSSSMVPELLPQTPSSAAATQRAPCISPTNKNGVNDGRRRQGATKYDCSVVAEFVSNRAKAAKVVNCASLPPKATRQHGYVYIVESTGETKKWDGRQWRRLCVVEQCHSAARGAGDFCISHSKGRLVEDCVNGEKVLVLKLGAEAAAATAPIVSPAMAMVDAPQRRLALKRRSEDDIDELAPAKKLAVAVKTEGLAFLGYEPFAIPTLPPLPFPTAPFELALAQAPLAVPSQPLQAGIAV